MPCPIALGQAGRERKLAHRQPAAEQQDDAPVDPTACSQLSVNGGPASSPAAGTAGSRRSSRRPTPAPPPRSPRANALSPSPAIARTPGSSQSSTVSAERRCSTLRWPGDIGPSLPQFRPAIVRRLRQHRRVRPRSEPEAEIGDEKPEQQHGAAERRAASTGRTRCARRRCAPACPMPIRLGGVPMGVPIPPTDAPNAAHQHHRGRERRGCARVRLAGPRVRCATIDSPIGNIIAVVAVLLIHIEIAVATAP